MVQTGDSDEDYTPTGADGVDDESVQDFEEDENYSDTDEYEVGDDELEVLSLSMPSFVCVASAERKPGCSTQTPDTEAVVILQLLLRYAHSPTGQLRIRTMMTTMAKTTRIYSIHPTGAQCVAPNAPETIGTQRSPNLSLPG